MINTGMAADSGGSDTIAGTVAGSVAACEANMRELESDTMGQGSTIGDLVAMPPAPDVDSTILTG